MNGSKMHDMKDTENKQKESLKKSFWAIFSSLNTQSLPGSVPNLTSHDSQGRPFGNC